MHNPALTIGLSMVLGMLAQVGSKHLHLPGIVLLLLSGILFGPDGLNWIDPTSIGPGLHILVGFAVAIILFEGGMNLRISRIMRERRAIRGLIIKGALVTLIGGTFITIVVLGWDFRTSILFGTLIVVTGPTVITPLLKRIRVHHGVSTILEAEGILLDAIGAIVAVVALEIAISPSGLSFVTGLYHIISRLGVGAILGISGGYLLTVMFRFRDLIPDGLENVFILSWVIALFQVSNTISPESGIAAVTIAGMTIGNSKTYIQQDLLEFKEQLTVLMIGMLFILLSADVRIEQIINLGMPGLITVGMLIFLIRPLSVFIGTENTGLDIKQKLLLSWIAPRGIVAAAVASLFVYELDMHGFDGTQLRALVFLLIIITVLLAGLTGGFVAGKLDLRRKSQSGWIILGAHEISRLLSRLLKKELESLKEAELWKLSQEMVSKDDCFSYTQGIMDLGATICTPSNPSCSKCPVSSQCLSAFKVDSVKKNKISVAKKVISMNLSLIQTEKSLLLAKNEASSIWKNLWLPFDTESVKNDIKKFKLIADQKINHELTHRKLEINLRTYVSLKELKIETNQTYKWIKKDRIDDYGLPKPISNVIKEL